MRPEDFPAGPFTTADARARGIAERQLGDAVRERVLRRVLRGVYVRADQPDDIRTAGRLRCPRDHPRIGAA